MKTFCLMLKKNLSFCQKIISGKFFDNKFENKLLKIYKL